MNANAGPPVATDETGKPVTSALGTKRKLIIELKNYIIDDFPGNRYSRDMNPSTENTTKPAKTLVEQFIIGTRIASLCTIEIEFIFICNLNRRASARA